MHHVTRPNSAGLPLENGLACRNVKLLKERSWFLNGKRAWDYSPRRWYVQGANQKMVQDTLRDARVAFAQGKAFSASINCPIEPPKPPAATQPPSLMKCRLILLTDNLCFSSCLAVTNDFRSLGAFHIGQTTDAATRFIDVREQYLPSGYSMFSTLQSVDPNAPSQVGPFVPALTYNGDIADTAALEAWVIATAVPAAAR